MTEQIINLNGFPCVEKNYSGYNKYVNFNINYNNEYCLYSGFSTITERINYLHNNYRLFYKPLQEEILNKYGLIYSKFFNNAIQYLCNEYSIASLNQFKEYKEFIKKYVNTYLIPSDNLMCKTGHLSLEKVFTEFNTCDSYLIHNRSNRFISGGGLVGVFENFYNFKPLFALVVKTDRVQVPRLSHLTDTPITQNDGMFQLYVQGGFDYKDTPYKSYRSLYRKHIIPWANKMEIPILTRPNLLEDLFLVPKIPTFASAREADQFNKQLCMDTIGKLKAEYQQVELEEPMPW